MSTRNVTTQESRTFRTLLLAVAIDSNEIGRRIKRAREGRGWTQLVFARQASVSPSTVQRWESGRLPTVRELIRVAGVLGISTDELVEPDKNQAETERLQGELAAEVDRLRRLNDQLEKQLATPERTRRDADEPSNLHSAPT